MLRDLRLVGRSGRTLASIEPPAVGNIYSPGVVLRDLGIETAAGTRVEVAVRQRAGEEERLVARAPITSQPACATCHPGPSEETLGWVAVELSLTETDRVLARSRSRLLLSGLAVTLLALGGIVIMVRQILGTPLDRLLRTMARVEAGHLGARVNPIGSDELGLVAERFNRMADAGAHLPRARGGGRLQT